jgi:hypothetical protein
MSKIQSLFPENIGIMGEVKIWESIGGVKKKLIFEKPNMIMNDGVSILSRLFSGALTTRDLKGFSRIAIGSSNLSSQQNAKTLFSELRRMDFTGGEEATVNRTEIRVSYLDESYTTASMTINTTSSLNTFTVNSTVTNEHLKVQAGDVLKIGLPSGNVFYTVASISGLTITLSLPLPVLPLAGTTVEQTINEVGLFTSESAAYSTGTVNVSSGSTIVTGVGTNWNSTNTKAGDSIRLSDSRKFYEILSVDSPTSITLVTPYLEATQTSRPYLFNGVMFGRSKLPQPYVKTNLNGLFIQYNITVAV